MDYEDIARVYAALALYAIFCMILFGIINTDWDQVYCELCQTMEFLREYWYIWIGALIPLIVISRISRALEYKKRKMMISERIVDFSEKGERKE